MCLTRGHIYGSHLTNCDTTSTDYVFHLVIRIKFWGLGLQYTGRNLEYWSGFAISMVPEGPLSLTCWCTLDLRSITPGCSLFSPSSSLFPLLLYFTRILSHTYTDVKTHSSIHTCTCTQLLIQAQEETELNLKKQSRPAERTIHHDLCVSETCVNVCGFRGVQI